ncbi:hypothetical protein HMI56_003619 [Coelomomyces lativittatus]|nr:hypothetical protein HMI56_003619 [Coelomomyces lativittatus]
MLPTFVDSASEHVTLIPMYRTQKLVYYEDDVNERWFSSMYFRGIMEMKKQDTVYPSADQELTMEDTQAWIEHMKEWAHHVGSLLPTVTTTTTSSTKLLPDPKPFDDVFSSTLSSSSSSLSPSPSLPTTTTTTTTAAATTSSINPGIYPSSSDPNLVIPKPETLGGVMKSPLIFSIQEWVEWMLGEVPYTTGIEDLFIWPAPKYTLFQVSPGE